MWPFIKELLYNSGIPSSEVQTLNTRATHTLYWLRVDKQVEGQES